MKIKNIFKNVAAAGACTLMMTGCASDYLDTPVHGIVDAKAICSTTDNARAAGMTLYQSMFRMSENLAQFQAYIQGELGLGYYIGEMPGQDMFINFINDGIGSSWNIYYNQENGYINSGDYVWNRPMWLYCYANIAQANEILHYIDDAEGDEATRLLTKAQVYTMRAHLYFRLLQVYAPRWEDSNNGEKLSSVVLRTGIEEQDAKEVAPMKDVLALIYSDLDDAIKLFEQVGKFTRQTYYEPTLNVAYGVYARVAALKHDWEKCREMAHNARQGYRPATTKEAMSGYMAVNPNDWMWAPSFNQDVNAIYGNWNTFHCCNTIGANSNRYTNSIEISLYRQIPETDARRDWWMTVDKLTGVNEALAYNTRMVDQSNINWTGAPLLRAARTWLDEHQAKYEIPGSKAYSGETSTCVIRNGAQVKFWADGDTGEKQMCQYPFMRATEMYLYEAEACAELGRTTEAQALLEAVNTPHNPTYKCTASGQALIDEVRLYRRIELWGEGFNWFDFKRWNIPVKRMAWVAGDVNPGNTVPGLDVEIPTTRNNGWRHGVPVGERRYNTAITTPIPGEVLN